MTKKITGLTQAEVAERQARGLTNQTKNAASRTVVDILRANILTPFNGIITLLALVVLFFNKSPINSLFFIAMLLNIIVGVAQELNAKRILDKLSILVKPRVNVIRNGRELDISSAEVVVDDLIVLRLGDQVVVDGRVIKSDGLEMNESLLTGESDPVTKAPEDKVMSGSMVVAGSGVIRAAKVGNQSYSAQLANEAKKYKRASSDLIDSTNKLLKWISWLMIIVVPILVVGQLRISDGNLQNAVIRTVAAIVGMIPEGLVLLTSAAFMMAVVKLARQRVLVQQLPAVETLARVNTLLLDKTGTITEGVMQFKETKILNRKVSNQEVDEAIATIVSRADSPTNNALKRKFRRIAELQYEVPFSSARKWSAAEINDKKYIFGAPEIILTSNANKNELGEAQKISKRGLRVLVLASTNKRLTVDSKLANCAIKPLALVILEEKIRSDAAQTLHYFAKQGVAVKIISGDSPLTVGAVADRVGLRARVYDAQELPDPAESLDSSKKFLQIVREHNVFGRVKPEQKRQITSVLQQDGDVVAMTGDGVNDALALKKADLGIAMNSGAAATRSVAEVVLLDDKFSHLPAVLGEGRRVTANIERVSNLFIIKNVYSMFLALSVTALGLTYPFLPAQMTIIGALSIGIPAFFLALAPNNRRYQPGFLRRVLSFAIPTGIVSAAAMIATYYLVNRSVLNPSVAGTSTSVVAMTIGMAVLIMLSQPLAGWKLALIAGCGGCFILLLLLPISDRIGFSLDVTMLPMVAIISVLAIAIVATIWHWNSRRWAK